jgi:(R)-2-hydroxyacyl-CoA dehydratese activating ATPase
MSTELVVGLDIGSTTTKAVVMDAAGTICGQTVMKTGGYFEDRARAALEAALQEAGCSRGDIGWMVATGYGRLRVPEADEVLTELSCHGRGAWYLVPREITVVDIGGQDNKFLKLGADGRRGRSRMNRKCAAGTGAFIENAARQLGLDCADLQDIAESADQVVEIGSFCTVFAGTEIIEHLRRGSSMPSIVRGVMRAVALRVFEMGRWSGEIVLTGGVAEYFPIVGRELEELSGCTVIIPPSPQIVGALGAALYAQSAVRKGLEVPSADGNRTPDRHTLVEKQS